VARLFSFAGGVIFLASLLYFAYWYAAPGAPASRLAGPDGSSPSAAAIDVALFTVFALHHSLLARTGIKRAMRAVLSETMERSTYVWAASVLFLGLCLAWRPVDGVIWSAGSWWLLPSIVQATGGAISVLGARRIGVLELAGADWIFARRRSRTPHVLSDGLYGLVRHPIYFGWVLVVWAAPVMTGSRLLFAAISTLYLALAVPFEERDLTRTFGGAYVEYQKRVTSKIVPFVY